MRECIHPQSVGKGWPRHSDFARLSQLTLSESHLGLLTPTDVFSVDKDGCHSSKLSASLGFFFRAMLREHLNRYLNLLA